MPDPDKITLLGETRRHLGAIEDIWRHEGFKKGIEHLIHYAGSTSLTYALLERLDGGVVDDPRLATELAGLQLQGPVGVAAGWDKSGRAALGVQGIGMRHHTPGAFTRLYQAGGPMPRLYTFDERVGDHGSTVSLNSFGFASPGVKVARANLLKLRESGRLHIPIIGQVTLRKEFYTPDRLPEIPGELAATITELGDVVDGISLGLSSFNTPGMRNSQDNYEFVYSNLAAAREATSLPLFYKADGDGGEARLEIICRAILAAEADGIELINSSGRSDLKAKYRAAEMPGGLAGGVREFQDMAVASVRYAYEAVGDRVAVHGIGGVGFGEDLTDKSDQAAAWQALRLLKAGASAVSLNSGIRHLKHRSARSIERGILLELDKNPQITRLGQIVGSDSSRGPKLSLAS